MNKKIVKVISAVLVICMALSVTSCNAPKYTAQKVTESAPAPLSDAVQSTVSANKVMPTVKTDAVKDSAVSSVVTDAVQEAPAPFAPADEVAEPSAPAKEDAVVTPVTPVVDGEPVVIPSAPAKEDETVTETVAPAKPETVTEPSFDVSPKGEYNEGTVLVKFEDKFDKTAFGTLSFKSAEPLYKGSSWYTVALTDSDKTEEAVEYLTGLDSFDAVDYDYVMGVTADTESAKVTDNPHYDKQPNLGLHNIPYGWTQNGKHPGGSPDVVVAVIDTGVDYNHLDLRNNIWKNNAEIAGNGRDDDGNGYVDDVYGWDFVGNDKDPIDDNGHGTHVAGIIAAENNKEGGIGVAYNCKVMVLKAGNSSGYFNNSDIAEAIQYAYMNGASVINMSFGGSQISVAVEEALANAYNTCVLVAAAGNDGACNNLGCPECIVKKVCYPAALPYVIGVMSTNANGTATSSFSNYDHYPYNTVEYEVYAVGEAVHSTWPNNKYADLNGTSMAAPTVSGIAALLRSAFSDREMYSTKYIQSQIVNTGTVCIDGAHTVADVQEALTRIPTPEVKLYDYSIDDSATINEKNNGNGVIDAGETVRLYVSLHNRGGIASDVNVSVDTLRNGEFTDPYFTIVNDTIALSDIGTYSVRESGDKYFEIIVSPDCPNDYLVDFNIRYTYKNGMDEKDKTVYEDDGKQTAQFNVSRGYHLPATITEDTTYKADKLYIVGEDVVIPAGVTVTFEEGCQIQFYDDREYYNSPKIVNYGTLLLNGQKENMISIYPNERHSIYSYKIENYSCIEMEYVNSSNMKVSCLEKNTNLLIHNSVLRQNVDSYYGETRCYKAGKIESGYAIGVSNSGYQEYKNNYIELLAYGETLTCDVMVGNYIVRSTIGSNHLYVNEVFENNIVYSTLDTTKTYSTPVYDIKNKCTNNIFASGDNVRDLVTFEFTNKSLVTDNAFSAMYRQYASQVIIGYYDSNGNPTVDVYGSLADASLLWPYVVSVEMFDKDGNAVTTVGKEEIKVRVTFNRPMDTTKDTFVTFGTIKPYADYRINGEYVSDTVWEGSYTLKAQIENGQNYLKVNNACAKEDSTKTVFGQYQLHEFTIDTTAAMAMNLQAVALDEGIELTFAQDDYDTLLGYNIYRSTTKDGNYVKLNPTILLPEENKFLDDNAEPGKTYWYTYTVVLSDFTESKPAGKVVATAKDTMAPSLYHTPVNQGYENNNLVISATASDNVAIENVTLYYRTVGESAWKSLAMSKVNDKYSATIFGSDVTLSGIEYYIVAKDSYNTVQKGSADAPYTVVVKSADSLLGLGDVDGNGAVTTKDALMLMKCLNDDLILTDDQFKRADLNGDTVLSSVEALRILQYINGKVTSLEM